MRIVIRYVVFLLLPVTLVLLWLSGVFHPKIAAEEITPETRTVEGIEIGEVEVVEVTHSTFSGKVVAERRVEVSTRTSGYVVKVYVDEGSRVKKGQALLRIDLSDIRSMIEEAERRVIQAERAYKASLARFMVAKRTYKRFERLFKEGAVTDQEFDEVRARFEEAKANLETARIQVEIAKENLRRLRSNLRYVEIKSPIDGYVSERRVDPGDLATPGRVLLVVEAERHRVEVSLPEEYVGKVKLGDRLKVRIDALGKTFSATVVEIDPYVDPSTRTFRIEAEIKADGIRSGMFAKVFVPEEVKTIAVPETALYRKWDFTGVWVVEEDGTLDLRFVRTGRRLNGKVEVLTGLREGERIVVRGVEKACEGCRVGGQ